MKEQIAIQNLLREKLTHLQSRNPRYSLRSFAQKVGVHVGALTYIMNGKRNVSRDLAERITRRLLLDPQQRSEILDLFPEKRRYRKAGDLAQAEVLEPRYLELSAAQFKVAAEWEHFAVRSLARCADFQSSPAWIAARLGITETRARQVIDRLVELGLMKLDPSGRLTRAEQDYRTTDDVANLSLKRHHEQSLELAKESLLRDDVAIRDFTSITMSIDPSRLSAAKELIRKQGDELSELLESGHRTEVYRLSVHLFPLSRIEPKGSL